MPKVRHTAKKEQTVVQGDPEGRLGRNVNADNRGPNPTTGNKPLPRPLLGAPRLPAAILDHHGKRKGKEVTVKDLGNHETVAGEGKTGEEDRCNEEVKGVIQRRTVPEENNLEGGAGENLGPHFREVHLRW